MLPSLSTMRHPKGGHGGRHLRRSKNGGGHLRTTAIGATAGLAVGAAAGALPFILRGSHGAAEGSDESAEE
jgi:hypothetical protein